MDIFSHHAYRLHGHPGGIRLHIHELVHSGLDVNNMPEVTYIEESADTLTLETVQTLQERLRTRVAPYEKRIVLISFSLGTREAQNALLKICEEPGECTTLFFITPSPYALLPTLRSRTQYLQHPTTSVTENLFDAAAFASAPYNERFTMIEPYIEEKSKERMIEILDALELFTLQRTPPAERNSFLHTLETVRMYILDVGCSPKLLLDLCALYMPRIQ